MPTNIVFRTDASLEIGTGHVIRCLTLADALQTAGAQCHFICREHPGNLIAEIRQRGFAVSVLPAATEVFITNELTGGAQSNYEAWLGADWVTDTVQTKVGVGTMAVDWLIVDHYAIDARWEQTLRPLCRKLMVVDDLADRPHCCDLLLDQNWFGDKTNTRYNDLVPVHCQCYLGPKFALLKPEYAQLRANMLPRDGQVRRVLVFLGGSDPFNQTAQVLNALSMPDLVPLTVDVVIGVNHPDPLGIQMLVEARQATLLHKNLPNLAGLMTQADLMVGAGGATMWERMCLGLPCIVISVAPNQTEGSGALMQAGYINFLGERNQITVNDISIALRRCLTSPMTIKSQSFLGLELVDGMGAEIIMQSMLGNKMTRHTAYSGC